jgi:hypothetical protein
LKMVCSLSAHFVTFSIPYLFQIVQLNFGWSETYLNGHALVILYIVFR